MMNNVNLIGRMTRNIEIRETNNGKLVTNFTLACNKFNNEPDFIPIVAWDKKAEILKSYTKKGSVVGITGRLQTRSYDDVNAKKRFVMEVVADNIILLDSRKKETENNTMNDWQTNDDSLPF